MPLNLQHLEADLSLQTIILQRYCTMALHTTFECKTERLPFEFLGSDTNLPTPLPPPPSPATKHAFTMQACSSVPLSRCTALSRCTTTSSAMQSTSTVDPSSNRKETHLRWHSIRPLMQWRSVFRCDGAAGGGEGRVDQLCRLSMFEPACCLYEYTRHRMCLTPAHQPNA